MKKLEIEGEILRLVQDSPGKLTTKVISDKLGVSISTASKYLEALKREGKVSEKPIGPSKLWSPGSNQIAFSKGIITLHGKRLVMMPADIVKASFPGSVISEIGKSIASLAKGDTQKERLESALAHLTSKGWGVHSLKKFDPKKSHAKISSHSIPSEDHTSIVLQGIFSAIMEKECTAISKATKTGHDFFLTF